MGQKKRKGLESAIKEGGLTKIAPRGKLKVKGAAKYPEIDKGQLHTGKKQKKGKRLKESQRSLLKTRKKDEGEKHFGRS